MDGHNSVHKKMIRNKTVLWLKKVQNQIIMKGWKEIKKLLKVTVVKLFLKIYQLISSLRS